MYELCDGDTLFDKELFNNKSEIKECTTMETAIRKSIGTSYEFSTLPTDLFIKKYAPEAEKSESAFYFIKNKETIITAIINQIYYDILRNRYIHWSSNYIESTYNTMNIIPHEPVRNNDVENFNRKRYIYNQ